jgi:hypothetical protein
VISASEPMVHSIHERRPLASVSYSTMRSWVARRPSQTGMALSPSIVTNATNHADSVQLERTMFIRTAAIRGSLSLLAGWSRCECGAENARR